MSKIVQWKRGNTTVSSTYIGAQGEITVNTDDYSLYVHDGVTPGGYKISNDSDSNVRIGNIEIENQTIRGTVANANIVLHPLGTGSVVANNAVFSGNITGNTQGFAIGFRDIPQVTFSANATAGLTDAGKHYYSTTAGNLTLSIPDNSNVSFSIGTTLTVVVNAAGNVLVSPDSGVTLYQAGSASTGNKVVSEYGLATIMKVAANTWVISGTGVS